MERVVKLNYYPETDSLYIELNPQPAAETRQVGEGINLDLAGDGTLVGIDIDRASAALDLSTLESEGLPLVKLKAA